MVAQEFDVEGINKLTYVKKGVTRITAVDHAVNLTELNLSNNLIEKIEGVHTLTRLKKLHLTANKIRRLENLHGLESLEHLLLQGNLVSSADELKHLQCLPNLKTLYLKNVDGSQPNPVCAVKGYREKVLALLPELRNLDGERLRGSAAVTATDSLLSELSGNQGGGVSAAQGRRTPRQSFVSGSGSDSHGAGAGGGGGGGVGTGEPWLKGFDWGEGDRLGGAGAGGAGGWELKGVDELRRSLVECKQLDIQAGAMVRTAGGEGGGGGDGGVVGGGGANKLRVSSRSSSRGNSNTNKIDR